MNLTLSSLHGGLLELALAEMKRKIPLFRQNCDLASGVSSVYMMKCCAADKIFNVNSGKIEISIYFNFLHQFRLSSVHFHQAAKQNCCNK